jgi:hypothetical protein
VVKKREARVGGSEKGARGGTAGAFRNGHGGQTPVRGCRKRTAGDIGRAVTLSSSSPRQGVKSPVLAVVGLQAGHRTSLRRV